MRVRQTAHHGYVSFRDDNTISRFTLDPTTGQLEWQEDVAVEGGPAPLAIAPDKDVLYVGRRDSQEIASYRIDPGSGRISLIGAAPLQGEPVYVATDRTGRFVLSAYYYQSTAGVHAVGRDGVVVLPPVEWRYTGGGAHAMLTDRSNRFAFVPHIANRGPNAIFQFRFNENTGRLTPNDPPRYDPASTWDRGPCVSTRRWTSSTSRTSRAAVCRRTCSIRWQARSRRSKQSRRCRRGSAGTITVRRFRSRHPGGSCMRRTGDMTVWPVFPSTQPRAG